MASVLVPRRLVYFVRVGLGVCVCTTLTLLALSSRVARADGPALDGSWTMTAVSENYTVQQWNAACGPAPVSRSMIPGGPVTVTTSGGELVISGAQTLRTDRCLDPMPTLARTVHSQDARAWRTRCATPPSDPRHAVVNTAYFVLSGSNGDNTISVGETGRYEFTIDDTHCVADVRRGAMLTRAVVASAAAAAASVATAAPTDSSATRLPRTPRQPRRLRRRRPRRPQRRRPRRPREARAIAPCPATPRVWRCARRASC